jgi:glutamate synthase (NADPH/NADH) large chain
MVGLERVTDETDANMLRLLIERHERETASRRASELLSKWPEVLPRFCKVVPHPETAPSAEKIEKTQSGVGNK